MTAEKSFKSASFGRLVLLFSGIMFLFLALSSQQTSIKLQKEHERHIIKEMETSLDTIVMQSAEDSFVFNRFQELIKTARDKELDEAELAAMLEKLKEKYGTEIKAFFYKNNVLKTAFGHTSKDLELFEPLLNGLSKSGSEFNEAQRKLHQKLMNGFGPGHRLELLKFNRNILKRFKVLENDQFYYWNTFPDGTGFFLITEKIPDFVNRFSMINPDKNLFGAGNPSKNTWVSPSGVSDDKAAAARIKAGLEGKNTVSAFGKRWFFMNDETGDCWLRIKDETSINDSKPIWADVIFKISSLLGLLSLILYTTSIADLEIGQRICRQLDSLSIKYRVLGLFSMASIFPALFTVLIGATSIADRIEIIENSVVSESISALEPLEKLYLEGLSRKEMMANDLRNTLIKRPPSEKLFSEYLSKYRLPRLLSRLEVRDGAGDTLFSTDDREVHGVAEAMDVFSRIALKLHAPARMGKSATRISPAEIVSESVLSTDEIGMATIMRQRGRQWVFRMGTFPTTWYWDAYPDIATGPAFMCFTTQIQITLQDQLQNELKKNRTKTDNISLASEVNYHYCDFSIFPQRDDLDLARFISAVMTSYRTGKVLFREMELNGRKYWTTIKPEKFINTTVLLHLISKSERIKSLNPLKSQLAYGAIIALVISLMGALLITRLIILPVNDLGNGIKAIRERQNDFRTPVRRNDEFGALATAFNNVIGELKELEYGKIVQESLLPSTAPEIEGYDLAFFTTSATDLAGDYHDAIKLDDGRVAVILGDVTGHGISAALAMAMAKATVNHTGKTGSQYPAALMEKLNALFNRELKPRHKFMTLVTIVLDPITGRLEIDNAGQSYPRFYNASSGISEEIQLPTMPLGAMKKRKGKIETREMQPGDAIILYSDGIIECSDETGDMYGYDRFYDHFSELMKIKTPAAMALNMLMQRLDSFRKPGPYPDDVTLVLLIRK